MGTVKGTYFDDKNAIAAVHQLVGAGYTKEQAAGIVGNLAVESGVIPTMAQHGGGPGRGVAQWSVGERYQQLLNYASAKHLNAAALSTQIDFLVLELNGSERAAGKAVKKATTAQEAAASFLTLDERPADQSAKAQAYRGAVAQGILDFYNGTPTSKTDPPPSSQNSTGSAIDNAVASVPGVASLTSAGGVLGDIGGVTKHLSDPSFWIRVAFVVGGLVVLFIAADKLASGDLNPSGTDAPVVKHRPVPVPV